MEVSGTDENAGNVYSVAKVIDQRFQGSVDSLVEKRN